MAKSTPKPSSSGSSQELSTMIGTRRFFPDKLIGQHMYELDLLSDDKYERLREDPEGLEEAITQTIQTLKPLYPPELCPTCLREAFPILQWRPPSDEVLAQWGKEGRAFSQLTPLEKKAPTEAELNIISSYLFHMLTDPDRMVEHNVVAIYRLWDSSFENNECQICASPLACEASLPDLVHKLGQIIDGVHPPLEEWEISYLLCLADTAKWDSVKEDQVRWLPALMGLPTTALKSAKKKLDVYLL